MADDLKQLVGKEAVGFVKPGMKLGIGTGSTAEAFVRELAKACDQGLNIIGVPTSVRTADLCKKLGVPLTTLDEIPKLDLTIDGADEIDPELNLIKGGGGALLREKIVAAASDEMLVIVDQSKLVETLGAYPLPIEVNQFGLRATTEMIKAICSRISPDGTIRLRMAEDDKPFITDGGHYIIDASFGRIVDPKALSVELNAIPGVVEHGLFTGLASKAIVAETTGIRLIEPKTI